MTTIRTFLRWAFLPVLVTAVTLLPQMQALQWTTLDPLLPGHAPHPDIVILAIDNKSISDIGRWPWERDIHAQLLATLQSMSPRATAIDVMFSEPSSEGDDRALAVALGASTNVTLPVERIQRSDGSSQALLPLALFREGTSVRLGHVEVTETPDNTARLLPTPLSIDGEVYDPFAVEIARSIGATPDDPSDRAILFAGPAGTYRTFSISDVIAGRIPRESIAEKIVLIGATASDLHDTVRAPKGSILAGVEWHANVLDSLLTGRFVEIPQRWAMALWAIALGLLTVLSFIIWPKRIAIAAMLSLLVLAPIISAAAIYSDIAWPYFGAVFTVAVTAASIGLWQLLVTDREKRRLRRTLQNYFSPRVMDTIVSSPDADVLGGKRREVSVLFSDIRNFTTISESSDPEMLCALLQEYFTAMSEEIHATDGVLEKFIGDAVMAFWGAPIAMDDHAERAVKTAMNMYERFRALRATWEERGIHGVDMGMAVNTGPVLVGNMGSRKRFNYGILGDTVNSASRMEGLNKEFKTHLIISKRTDELLPPSVERRSLGKVMVKGKTKPILVFEVPITPVGQ